MQINVSGKGVNVGESLRAHVEKKLQDILGKYLDRVTSAQVVVTREAHLFCANVTGNMGTHAGMVVRGRGESEDVYAACDEAIEKIEKQLRRYKRRITNHHKADQAPKAVQGTKYVLPPHVGEDEGDKPSSALVIAEKPTEIDTLTVSEAVMKMDLQDLPALLFFNKAHGGLNVVYRRADGNISWVDPKQAKVA